MALNVPARSSGLAATVIPFVVLVVGLFAAIAVYTPGLSGPFFFDDIFNIQNNPNLRLAQLDPEALRLAAFSTDSGPFQRPISMASFALNFYFFGEGAASFKAVNLGIHLLNGVLIFLLSRLLLRQAARRADLRLRGDRAGLAAGLIAAVWLVHPLNLTGVLYAVQRMTSLSALFVLLALLAYLQGRLRLPDRRLQGVALLAASALFWLCGLASKENALLLPWYIFLIEWLFLYPLQPRQPPAPGVRRLYLRLVAGAPGRRTRLSGPAPGAAELRFPRLHAVGTPAHRSPRSVVLPGADRVAAPRRLWHLPR